MIEKSVMEYIHGEEVIKNAIDFILVIHWLTNCAQK